MENPQNYIQLKEKKHANTLRQTGGIGTVATRADIIEKLFNLNAIESRDGKIKVTSKRKANSGFSASRINISIINCRVGRETIINRKRKI